MAFATMVAMSWFKQIIENQRFALSRHLEGAMGELATACAGIWSDSDGLDGVLQRSLPALSLCQLLYAMDTSGRQISSNILPHGVDQSKRGQDLSHRPFLSTALPWHGFLLSEVYLSRVSGRTCITAVQAVHGEEEMLGFVAADFDLRDLPLLAQDVANPSAWRQIRGDPAIRGTLFQQQRVKSAMDEQIEDVIAILDELLCERGVFHAKLHFSSSRATLWLTDDPYRYRLHVLEEIIDPSVCLAYPLREYPAQASITPSLIKPALERFRMLRDADENVYLRSGSINVINGMVGLTFSCDGSHYMPVPEFLEKDDAFWFGAALDGPRT